MELVPFKTSPDCGFGTKLRVAVNIWLAGMSGATWRCVGAGFLLWPGAAAVAREGRQKAEQ